jgi:hypothetical protein
LVNLNEGVYFENMSVDGRIIQSPAEIPDDFAKQL